MATITLDTPLTGPSPLTEAQIVSGIMARNPARPDFTREVVRLVVRKCAAINLRGDVWVADAALETDNFSSPIYRQYGNIGGLGVFDDGTNVGGSFTTPEIAASAFVAHAMAYCYGRALPAGEGWIRYDPRWSAAIDRVTRLGTTTIVRHLGNGNWATNPTHAADLVSRYNALFASFTLPTEPTPEVPPMAKPTIILVAGHRSDNDSGNPNEKQRTPALANAYLAAFRAAGYTVRYVQNEDGDGRPDITSGGLDTVSAKTRTIMQGISGSMVLLDLHFEGANARGVFAIVPDETGLVTAVAGGTPGNDTWANNPLDVTLAGAIARTIAAATGLPLRSTTQPGIMSERHTGVGYQGYRLATMAYSAWCRDRAVRLVVEHGSLPTADVTIINQPGFAEKCAAAAVAAVNAVYAVSTPAPQPEPEPEPEPEPQPGQKHELPKGMTVQLARRLFDRYDAPWGEVYAFDLTQAPSQVWLSRGKRSMDVDGDWQSGNWPALRDIIRRGDGSELWRWEDGSTYHRKTTAQAA